MPFSVGVRVRTVPEAKSKVRWASDAAREHVRWGESGTVILEQQGPKGIGHIFRVSHELNNITHSLPWYERSELDLEHGSNDPAAWLILNLLKRWDQDEARVLADAIEERGLHGAAFTLRMPEVCLNIRDCVEQLSVVFGVRGNARAFSMYSYQEGWVPGVARRGATGATGPASPFVPGPVGATGSTGVVGPSGLVGATGSRRTWRGAIDNLFDRYDGWRGPDRIDDDLSG